MYNASQGRAAMFWGGTQADKLQRRYRRFYAADGSMEITFDALSNKTTFVTYMGGDAYGAPAIWHSEQTSATTEGYFYLFRDYLGSILAITDSAGVIKEKRIFDAWGELVKLTDGNNNVLTNFTILDRGYTGHEHLLGVGLVHMNGRLYDPKLHRFLMPDNFVQDPYNTQNFNRYGYVLNNPLSYTDPSGEFIFAAIIGAAIGVIVNGVSNLINGRGFFVGAGKAALFGAIGGAAAFGIGQVAANITTSIGSAAATTFQLGAHAILGGTLSVAGGGNFGSGALAGGISSGIGSATGGFLRNAGKFWKAVGIVGSGSVSGGIGSRLGGGNFWDGFRQGAISSGLNHLAHSIQQNKINKQLISKMEQAIEAQRQAILRMINSDPNNPLPDSFKAIDFNIDGLKYSKGLFATNNYGFKGVLKVGDFEIEFNANYKIRPNNFVTQVSEVGSGATPFGEVLVNAFQFTGSGQVIRMNIPSDSQNQLLKDYLLE